MWSFLARACHSVFLNAAFLHPSTFLDPSNMVPPTHKYLCTTGAQLGNYSNIICSSNFDYAALQNVANAMHPVSEQQQLTQLFCVRFTSFPLAGTPQSQPKSPICSCNNNVRYVSRRQIQHKTLQIFILDHKSCLLTSILKWCIWYLLCSVPNCQIPFPFLHMPSMIHHHSVEHVITGGGEFWVPVLLLLLLTDCSQPSLGIPAEHPIPIFNFL